jgi:hypothetical protein
MNEANKPEVGHTLGSILLWCEGNVCRVEPMEIICAKAREIIDDHHDVHLNSVPISHVKL